MMLIVDQRCLLICDDLHGDAEGENTSNLWCMDQLHPRKLTAGTPKLVVWVNVSPFPLGGIFRFQPLVLGRVRLISVACFFFGMIWGSKMKIH